MTDQPATQLSRDVMRRIYDGAGGLPVQLAAKEWQAVARALEREQRLKAELRLLVRLGGQVPTEQEGYVWSRTGLGGLREDRVPEVVKALREEAG